MAQELGARAAGLSGARPSPAHLGAQVEYAIQNSSAYRRGPF